MVMAVLHPHASEVEPRPPEDPKGESHAIARPILKIAGGKRQLLPQILPRVPETFGTYYEPMMGGAALFFHLWSVGRLDGQARVVLGDASPLLCELVTTVRDGVESVLPLLRAHERVHGKDHFLAVRDRLGKGNLAERAADLLYLSRTCFNGLLRFSKSGRFNTPMGRYTNPRICPEDKLRASSLALQSAEIVEGDFEKTCEDARPGDFVYFDPPYLPIRKTSSFVGYTKDGFSLDDHERLRALAARLKGQGTHVLLSHSSAAPIREMYAAAFEIEEVSARRSINAQVSGRGPVTELLIR